MPFKKGRTPKGARTFKKGKSGNPQGRPPGIANRASILKKWLAEDVDLKNLPPGLPTQKGTVEEQIILTLIGKAVKGDMSAIREVLDSVYGKQGNTNLNFNPNDLKNLTDAELDDLISRFSR